MRHEHGIWRCGCRWGYVVAGVTLFALWAALPVRAASLGVGGYAGLRVSGPGLDLGVEGELFFLPGASLFAGFDWGLQAGETFGVLGLRAYAPEPEGLYGGLDFGAPLEEKAPGGVMRVLVGYALPLASPSVLRLELASVEASGSAAEERQTVLSVGFGRVF